MSRNLMRMALMMAVWKLIVSRRLINHPAKDINR